MALDLGQLLVIDNVEQFHLEPSLLRARRRHVLRVLASANKHVELLVLLRHVKGVDGRISANEVMVEDPDGLEGLGVQELARAVPAAGQKHAEVNGLLDRKYFALVHVLRVVNLLGLNVVSNDSAPVGGVDQVLV
eukprot:CAMPEP_0168626070 /NCGR_PEP_ID=MMETSP0449_2-20121227/10409_1 /TAXON_ID=1082188 /ORGANISM="Strombidium rassoulzadegani, Strain ras09" /LENGTH=134 /DNA_ID=CAMNT_0008667987 /DNA_START=96 /DNA_END=500 /DNA_ORIENTATION=+